MVYGPDLEKQCSRENILSESWHPEGRIPVMKDAFTFTVITSEVFFIELTIQIAYLDLVNQDKLFKNPKFIL